MAELKGSKTEQNLMTAFAGESQARNKYTFYASKAKKEGYMQIARFFEETAGNEKEHAEIWFKELHGAQFPQRPKTSLTRLPANIMNGRICTPGLQKPQKKKALPALRHCSKWSERLKKNTKIATENCSNA